MNEPLASAENARTSIARPLGLIALVALALRIVEAAESSLWRDELHTLAHASGATLGAVIRSVQAEYHTPLFFGFVHLFGGFEWGAWLRAIPVVSSVAMLLPLATVARECGLSTRATLSMAWLYACLPYQVLYGAELRPYAWIGGFSMLAFLLAFSERRSSFARLALFFLSILLGLLTHRLMAIALCSIGAARLISRKPRSVPLWGLIVSGTLAVGGFLPWLLNFAQVASTDRFEHDEAIGGYRLRPTLVKELLSLPSRIVTPYMRELGSGWGMLELAATGAFALGLCVLLFRVWRGRRSRVAQPVLRGLWVYALVQFVITTVFAVWTWDSAPLQYYTPMAWTIPVLIAAGLDRLADARTARFLTLAFAATSLAMGVALVGGKSREDLRGGIAAVRALGSEARAKSGLEPIYSALLRQPDQFANSLPYRAYGPDLDPIEPSVVPRLGDSLFQRPLILLRCAVQPGRKEWLPITTDRRQVREVKLDRYVSALWFEPLAEK